MPPEFSAAFVRLRKILAAHDGSFEVRPDENEHYGLVAPVGPASLAAWKGKVRSKTIPVARVQVEKSYVSFHLMGVYGNPKLLEGFSERLRARMQGKSCFNFKTVDEPLFEELERLTTRSIEGMRKAGFIS